MMIKCKKYKIKSLYDNIMEQGARLFHNAVRNAMSGWTEFTVNGDALGVVKKVASPLHENALSVGYQFTEYLAPNGVKLKIEVDSFYDDPVNILAA